MSDRTGDARDRRAQAEVGPPGGLTEVLTRWERSGGVWRVLSIDEEWIAVGLFSCDGGEQMGRVTSARTRVLRDFLRGRSSSEDDTPSGSATVVPSQA